MSSTRLFQVDDNALETILKAYDRTEESLKKDVDVLKKWMSNQPHFPEILDEKAIENFLILNKCSIEKTKNCIDMYYTLRSEIPDFFENANPKGPIVRETMEIAAWVLLPKMTENMYRISFFKMLNKNLIDRMEPVNLITFYQNLQEIRLREDIMFGDISIFDMDGINFKYIMKLTPSILVKILTLYEKIYSIPLKGMYIINSPPFISSVLAILKTIMKPKLFERIHICKDTSLLEEAFPKEILPRDYGGEEKSVEELHELLKLKLNEYQDRFDKLDGMKIKEELRPEKLKNDEILGFYGNFKKLSVD